MFFFPESTLHCIHTHFPNGNFLHNEYYCISQMYLFTYAMLGAHFFNMSVPPQSASSKPRKYSIFDGVQVATTVSATLLFLRSCNRYIPHAERGRAIVACAGWCFSSSLHCQICNVESSI
uniref:7TM_GPCR_Srx domain-containing protein n=1 Tax=Ascaris lumbricoides TaxID=6252 RepID=A0A0M3IJJ8_ASCLU